MCFVFIVSAIPRVVQGVARSSLPELPVLLFSRDFDDSRLVYYSRGSIALFYDTDYPRLITLLLLDILAVRRSLEKFGKRYSMSEK